MKRTNVIMLAAVLLVTVAWLATPLLLKSHYPDSPINRGLFGDMFGAVNALFTGFALIGATYAILLQSEELKLQREELALQRLALQRSAEEFQLQNQLLREQLETSKLERATAENRERIAARPIFRTDPATRGSDFTILNVGADVFEISLRTSSNVTEAWGFPKSYWKTGESFLVHFRFGDNWLVEQEWWFSLSYLMRNGTRTSECFVYKMTIEGIQLLHTLSNSETPSQKSA